MYVVPICLVSLHLHHHYIKVNICILNAILANVVKLTFYIFYIIINWKEDDTKKSDDHLVPRRKPFKRLVCTEQK